MTPSSVVTTTPARVSASGDPHLVNVHGQRFDIFQPGVHTLLQLPQGIYDVDTLLRVQADAKQLGGACADMYFQTLNFTGRWVRDVQARHGKPSSFMSFHAQTPKTGNTTSWMHFGKVDLKVVWGHTSDHSKYLNMYARHLSQTGIPIGGLLGNDDHTAASTPSPKCKRTMTLLSFLQAE